MVFLSILHLWRIKDSDRRVSLSALGACLSIRRRAAFSPL